MRPALDFLLVARQRSPNRWPSERHKAQVHRLNSPVMLVNETGDAQCFGDLHDLMFRTRPKSDSPRQGWASEGRAFDPQPLRVLRLHVPTIPVVRALGIACPVLAFGQAKLILGQVSLSTSQLNLMPRWFGLCGLCRTYSPQPFGRAAKHHERPMISRVKRMLTVFDPLAAAGAFRHVWCRHL